MEETKRTVGERRDRRIGDSPEGIRLETERARLASAIDQASESIVVTDPSGVIQFVNPAFERLTGYSRAEAVGRNPSILKSGAQDRAFYEAMWAILSSGETWRGTFVNRARDGRLFEEDATISPVFDAAGTLINYVAVKRDVTREREAERVLRESERQFRTIFDSVTDGVAISEPGGAFREVNRALCERLGYSREELLGMSVSAINTPESAATIDDRVREMVVGHNVAPIDVTHVRRDGSTLAIEAVSCRMEYRGRPAILSVYRDITERKRSEDALREQARFLQELLDALPIPITAKDLDGHIQIVNSAFTAGPGLPREELIGKTYRELGQPEADLHEAHDIPVLEGKGPTSYEASQRLADGSVRRLLLTKAALRSKDGRIVGIVTGGPDISDRYRAEQELRQSEERFRTLFDLANDAIFITEMGGKFIEVNRTACERLGYSRDELLRMSPAEITAPEFAGGVTARGEEISSLGSTSFETAHLRRDGRPVPVEVSSRLIDLAGRKVVLSIARDIGDRKRAEAALRESEARFRTLINQAPIAISVSRDGVGLYANRRLIEMLGLPNADSAIGRPIAEYFAPEAREASRERTRRRADGLATPYEWESIGCRADGTRFPVHVAVERVELPDGPANLGFVTDISERKAAEQAREQAQEELAQAAKEEDIGRLAGGIAHDFNNLLTAIRGSASLALAALPEGEGPREDLLEIEQVADRGAALTRQLLAFARRTALDPEVVDLGAIVRHLEPMLRRLIGDDIALVTSTPEGTSSVLADPGKIEQVIVNLALNARDAMPSGGTLTIATADSPESPSGTPTTTLSVTDTGVGMDAEVQSHLFEPFFTTKGPKGTGLGLASVFGIARQSGGTVTASSTPGAGSTFTLHLPRAERASGERHEPEVVTAVPMAGGATGTILVVEDDSGVRRYATRVLGAAGYDVVAAPDGATAIRLAAERSVQVLLTDMVMPGVGGREVALRLAELQPGVGVVYMSGHADKDIVTDGVLAEGIEFVAKPFDATTLLKAVQRAMAGSAPDGAEIAR